MFEPHGTPARHAACQSRIAPRRAEVVRAIYEAERAARMAAEDRARLRWPFRVLEGIRVLSRRLRQAGSVAR